MKRFFLTCTMLLVGLSAAFAQAQIGLRAGANWATIVDGQDAMDGVEEPWRPGITLGIASSFQINEMFAIAPELNYSQRGYKMEFADFPDESSELRFNYLEVPILFRLSFGDVLKGYVNAGPAFSYWLGGKDDDGDKIDFDDSEDFKRFEIGASVGGGVQLDTEAGSFLIDLRYTRGFTDLIGDLSGDDQFKNQLIGVSLIFLVPSLR